MANESDTGLAADGAAPTAPTDVVATATAEEPAVAPNETDHLPQAVTKAEADGGCRGGGR